MIWEERTETQRGWKQYVDTFWHSLMIVFLSKWLMCTSFHALCLHECGLRWQFHSALPDQFGPASSSPDGLASVFKDSMWSVCLFNALQGRLRTFSPFCFSKKFSRLHFFYIPCKKPKISLCLATPVYIHWDTHIQTAFIYTFDSTLEFV
jgi:hypothetical protein